jgi:putative tricarboxylic transport membrane protein
VRRFGANRAAIAVSWWTSLNKSELVTACFLIALGAFIASEAWDWPYLTKDGPGPGFFPLWIGISLIGLAALLIALQVADAIGGKASEKTRWEGTGPVLGGWVALMVAAALLKPAGFITSFVVLSMFLVRVIFRQSWFAAITVSVVSALVFWALFEKLLKVRLPAGPLGF